jgi:hypothetical protein
VLPRERHRLRRARDRLRRARHQRGADPGRDGARRQLVAERADDPRRRADPGQPGVDDGLGEVRVLGQEAVAGVQGGGPGVFGGGQQLGYVEVGGGRGRRVGSVEGQRLVGQPGVGGAGVGVGVDRDAGQAGVTARSHYPQRDLAAVGDQHPLEVGGERCGHDRSGWS